MSRENAVSGDRGKECELDVWEDIVLAMLAVYQYPIDRIETKRDAMRRADLFDPRKLASSSIKVLTEELRTAGYDRGGLTWQYADRLISLGKHVARCDSEELQRLLRAGGVEEIRRVLLPIYGVGPKVVENFGELRRRRQQDAASGSGS
jgi:endonuclease III-like uncharacterized protein